MLGRLSAIALLLAGASSECLADAGAPVPAQAHLVVAARNVSAACRAFAASPLGAEFCGERFQPLIKSLAARGEASPLYLPPAMGFGWPELAATDGPAKFVAFSLPGKRLGMAAVFPTAGERGNEADCLTRAREYFAEKRYQVVESQVGEVRITTYSPPSAAQGQATRALFAAPDYSGIANSAAAAEAIIAATVDDGLRKQLVKFDSAEGPEDEVFVILRPWNLAQAVRDNESANAPAAARSVAGGADELLAGDWLETARRVGWDAVDLVESRVRFAGASPWQWQSDFTFVANRPFPGALRMLDFQPGNAAPTLLHATADATSWTYFRWDFSEAVRGFATLFDDANEPGPDGVGLFDDMLAGLLEDPEGPQVDLRRDLIGQLGPEVVRVTGRSSEGGEDAALYVAAVRHRSTAFKCLANFYRDDDRVRHSRIDEVDVWTVPPGNSLFVEGESDSLFMIRALALDANMLMFSTDDMVLNRAIRSPYRETAGPPWKLLYAALVADQPPDAAAWSINELSVTAADSYRRAITGSPTEPDDLASQGWRLLFFGQTKRTPDLPYAAASKFADIRQSLPLAGVVVARIAEGWRIQVKLAATDEPSTP